MEKGCSFYHLCGFEVANGKIEEKVNLDI